MRVNIREPADAKAKRQVKEAKQAEADEVRSDPLLAALHNFTPAQVSSWIEDNVNSLADAKKVLKLLAKAVVMLSRE